MESKSPVSRLHARVSRDGDAWLVEDLDSRNGVKVGGAAVPRATVRPGQPIQIGDVVAVIVTAEPEESTTTLVHVRSPADAPECPDWLEDPDVTLRIAADRDVVEAVSDALPALLAASCLDADGARLMHMAASEAIVNAYRHGTSDDPDACIRFRLVREPGEVRVVVRDDGPGFDVTAALNVAREGDAIRVARERWEAGSSGGLGLMLMIRCVDLTEYNGAGNEVTLVRYSPEVMAAQTIGGTLGFVDEPPPEFPDGFVPRAGPRVKG